MQVETGDKPLHTGTYVAYVNGLLPNWADKKLLHWDGNRWCHIGSDQYYRDTVYGYVGPLPAMPLVP